MSPGVEDSPPPRSSTQTTEPAPPPPEAAAAPVGGPEHRVYHSHHVLIEPQEDRWRWRRKIRADPRKLFFYRMVVALAGMLLVVLGCLTGPLPGPGGIPLVLLGLAIWASEFEWAHRVMLRFKALLHRYQGWSRPQQVGFWVAFVAICGALGYLYMLVVGIPFWVPRVIELQLERLPGLAPQPPR